MPHDKQKEIFADCEAHGEDAIRDMLAQGRWNAENTQHVHLWLARKEAGREALSNAEQMRVTRSAKNAAWAAAIAAIIAAIAAGVTAYLSLSGAPS